ncbi:hypothetical protein WJX75_006498 [Coccomyxa subellipsoidea]|uniref:Uncharacterized protein n=1 Tax=Coccomyxa subellipsoidea TaxID=248742 RepID=A0ABR2YWC8_9CHLO
MTNCHRTVSSWRGTCICITELAEMQARCEVEESDHTLAERTAAAEQDLGPWNPAAVSGSDSGEWKDAGVKRRARSRSPDSRRGSKKAPHHGGRGGEPLAAVAGAVAAAAAVAVLATTAARVFRRCRRTACGGLDQEP